MLNHQEKIVPQPQFEFIFNRELSQNIDKQEFEKFKCQSILYCQEIMICDLMLLLENGKMMNQKLSIAGYLKLMDLIKEFRYIQKSKNQFTLLNYCVIKNIDGQLLIESKFKFKQYYPSLENQIDELQAKFSQFVDQKNNKGQDLEEILKGASNIYSQFSSPKKENQNNIKNELFYYIQDRFFAKQFLIHDSDEEQKKSLQYFQDIFKIIQCSPNYEQILDLLIEVDFTTLEQIQQFVKQKEFQHSEVCLMNDFELFKYYIVLLKSAQFDQQKIKDGYAKCQNQEDKRQYIDNQINNLDNLMSSQNKVSDPQDSNKFQQSLINQLKIKFWVFFDYDLEDQKLQSNRRKIKIKDKIYVIKTKYSNFISLKQDNKYQFEKFVQTIINDEDMEQIIEEIIELKIEIIHENVRTSLKNGDLKKHLEELFNVNKKLYLPLLKNHPTLKQQVDILLDYCERIKIMIQNLNQKQLVDFKQDEQLIILRKQLESTQNVNTDLYIESQEELQELTNRFCPNLCIFKSTRFQRFKQRIEQKISKQMLWNQINSREMSEAKSKMPAEFFNQYQFPLSKYMTKRQGLDQLRCGFYCNKTWNNLQDSLKKELQNQIKQDQKFADEKAKMYKQYQNRIFIPIEKIDLIYKHNFDQKNEKKIMEEIAQFFDKKRQEEECFLKDLQEYVELADEFIKTLDQEKNDYFKQQFLNYTEYKSIEEMQDDVQKIIQNFRKLKFQKYEDDKSLIEKIHKDYMHKCQEVLKIIPQDFKRFKLAKQNREDLDKKKKIIEFYGSQLLEFLKLQIQNNQAL
ncbi:unnamed protein product [Paramecium octaurelia]|uniref:Uncharacterized protein n=1 Tax=Paramecium octaurelia TaxID=43137 RepID=A0A8S1V4T3_PAROT|nr:unnamed protein product [Paramecium octaurelia]